MGQRTPTQKTTRPPDRYVRTSSFVKNVLFDSADGAPQEKVQVHLTPGETEEIAFTLVAGKVEDLLEKIKAAQNDPACDGGIRITIYCSHKTNGETGEQFDGASMTVTGKFPAKGGNNFGKKGSFAGSNGARGGGQGRRDYPSQQSTGARQPQNPQASANTAPVGPNVPPVNSRDEFEKKNMQEQAPEKTQKFNQEPRW